MITEYARHGSLAAVAELHYDDANDITKLSDVVCIVAATQVNEGLMMLHSQMPEILHRDLAARNVLVRDFNPNIPGRVSVVIADFGLARQDNYYYGGVNVPIRWMPPEVKLPALLLCHGPCGPVVAPTYVVLL